MDKSDLIKYAAMAGAAYLVYTWYKSQSEQTVLAAARPGVAPGATSTTPAVTSPGVQVSPGTQIYSETIGYGTDVSSTSGNGPRGTRPGGGTASNSTPAAAAPAQDVTVRLAIDEAYATASYPGPLYNADQWNWYRQQGGKPIFDAAVLANPRDTPLTAMDYHRRMAVAAQQGAVTLSGLGLGFSVNEARMPARYPWVM